jgi:hypothetical protein
MKVLPFPNSFCRHCRSLATNHHPLSTNHSRMALYSLYGITFSSTVPFRSPVLSDIRSPRLEVVELPAPLPIEGGVPIMELEEQYWALAAPYKILRMGDRDVELFLEGAQIWVEPNRIAYAHAPGDPRHDYMDVRLVGVGFAWWLLRQGIIPLHSGALELNGELALFTAESGMGKSSLMSSFVSEGYPLVSDDFVGIHYDAADGQLRATSAYPQMRLWPNSVSQFFDDPAHHPTVFEDGDKRRVFIGDGNDEGKGFGRFARGEYPISRIYLLERRPETTGEIRQERLSGTETFMTLLASMIMGAVFPVTELAPIWDAVQALTEQVPFYRLSYPTGWDHLPAVKAKILSF